MVELSSAVVETTDESTDEFCRSIALDSKRRMLTERFLHEMSTISQLGRTSHLQNNKVYRPTNSKQAKEDDVRNNPVSNMVHNNAGLNASEHDRKISTETCSCSSDKKQLQATLDSAHLDEVTRKLLEIDVVRPVPEPNRNAISIDISVNDNSSSYWNYLN